VAVSGRLWGTEAADHREDGADRPWDCTKRHVPTGSAGVLMSMAISGHKSGLSEGEFQELLGRVSRHDKRLIADRDWVASLLNARQRLVDAQEDVRR
jgi:hypothetical protein